MPSLRGDRSGHLCHGVTDVATWRALTRRHAAPPVALGLDGDFGSDLLARQAGGTLTLHPTASSTSGRFVNTGWQGLDRVISTGDFSGDGKGECDGPPTW